MTILQAIILGLVQGLTEFIPISSTAHLIFTERWLQVYADSPERQTAVTAVVQLGTLLAVLTYFAGDLLRISLSFARDHLALLGIGNKRYFYHRNTGRSSWMSDDTWLGWLVIIGSIPVGTIGLLLKKVIESSLTKNLWLIAIMMIGVAVLLVIAELVGRRRKEIEQFGIFDGLAQGFAQCLALIPGASRSGSTIMAGLFAGETREAAARFSFLLSIPAVGAAGLLELKEAYRDLPQGDFVPLAVGVLVSALIGYAAIWFLLWYLRTRSSAIFIIYRLIVGSLILTGLWYGYLQP